MKYFKYENDVYAFELDGSQDHLIPDQHIPMSADEIDRHINPENYLSDEEKYALYLESLKPLTRRQFRMILVLNGYDLDEIKSQILAIEDIQTKQLTLIEWEDANTFERTSLPLVMMVGLLQLNEDQVNAMWEHAMTL